MSRALPVVVYVDILLRKSLLEKKSHDTEPEELTLLFLQLWEVEG